MKNNMLEWIFGIKQMVPAFQLAVGTDYLRDSQGKEMCLDCLNFMHTSEPC